MSIPSNGCGCTSGGGLRINDARPAEAAGVFSATIALDRKTGAEARYAFGLLVVFGLARQLTSHLNFAD